MMMMPTHATHDGSTAHRLLQQQIELLADALRQRMELLPDSGLELDGMARGGCFRHVELTSDERSAKGLTEQPSALELSTVGLLEGSEAAARDADAEDLRRWIESRSDTLSRFLNEQEDVAPETSWCPRSPLTDIRAAPGAHSPTFEQPASPIAAVNADIERALSSMHATIAAMAARHVDCTEAGSPETEAEAVTEADWATRIEQSQESSAGEEFSLGATQCRGGTFADPPAWQHVDPHPHLSLDLGLETISPEADWRDFLAPQEVLTEQRVREARWRLVQRLPFTDEPTYDAEGAERMTSCDDVVAEAGQQRVVLARSDARAQLCMECFDCPCACSGVKLGGGLHGASLCLACCNPGGCSCD